MNRIIILITLFFASSNILFAQVDTNLSKKNVVTIVESNPEFPGGEDSLLRFLISNLKYPKKANANGIEGKVNVGFVICEDGSLCDFQIIGKPKPLLDNEAIRVIKLLPKFRPALINNTPVPFYFDLPITFTLENDKSEKKKRRKKN